MDKLKYRHQLVGPPHLWEMKRRFQHQFLVAEGLMPPHALLDLGCGTLRGGIPLIDYLDPGRYVGIDVRPEAITEARRELAEHDLQSKAPRLLVADDLGALELPERFDFAWAFSVLIHMTDEVLREALGFVARHLRGNGVFYANVNLGQREAATWRAFPVVWRSFERYAGLAAAAGLEARDMGPLRDLGHDSGVAAQDAQRMLAMRPVTEPRT